MTRKEFIEEGQKNTEKELEKLREYCKSPQFDKWKAMKKMNSKNLSRFASFIDGEEHVSDSEVFEHFSHVSICESQFTDDESDDDSIGIDD